MLTAEGAEALAAVEEEWNALAVLGASPFLTTDWLSAWWRAFGAGVLRVVTLREPSDGRLRAGVAFAVRRRRLSAPANYHSGNWDAVAADDEARAELWSRLATSSARELVLTGLPDAANGPCAATLTRAGFRLVREPGQLSPMVILPSSFDSLLRARSSNLRSQVGRRTRALARAGTLTFRTGRTDGADLDAVFRVEGGGWKRAAGTAILADPRAERLYREFARSAAERGWLRLHLLELDGEPIAADYAVAFAGGEFLLKTGFDERYRALSPGLVLRAHVLRAAIEEGLSFYDFLGEADAYKLRWTNEVRPRVTLRAYRGPVALPAFAYRRGVRPVLKSLRDDLTRRSPRSAQARAPAAGRAGREGASL